MFRIIQFEIDIYILDRNLKRKIKNAFQIKNCNKKTINCINTDILFMLKGRWKKEKSDKKGARRVMRVSGRYT